MIRNLASLCAVVAIAACGSTNPFMDETTDTVATEDPSTANSKFVFDLDRGLTMNSVEYDQANDELVINNLPFDGPGGRYDRIGTRNGAGIYQSRRTATTGQIDHYAVFIKSAELEAAAAAGEDWVGFGYGGANIKRDSYALPGGVGEYVYNGVYAAVRTRDDRSGLELVNGDARLLLDVLDLDNDGTVEGSIAANITGRTRTTAAGATLDPLPDIFLARVSYDPTTGTFVEGEASTTRPDGTQRDSGAYEGFIAGADGSEVGATVVMEGPSEIQQVSYQVVEWSNTETINITDPTTGLVIGTQNVTTTGTISGLNGDNRDSIVAQVDSGQTVGYLSADTSGLPATATITSSSTETETITGDGNAREIGVLVTEQQP